MRLPFPTHIRLWHAVWFAVALSAIQVYQGTSPQFALGSFLLIVIATVAFNVAGGLSRPSGSYIFFFSVLAGIVGLVWKAVINEPADLNLAYPVITIYAYVGAVAGMLAAVLFSNRFRTKKAFLDGFVTDDTMDAATIGCMTIGIVLSLITMVVTLKGGSILSALNQLNRFTEMALLLGVINAIRKSGGTRSVSIPVLLTGTFIFFQGVVNFSKQGMITPFACWVFAAASQRYRVSGKQILGGAAIAFVIFHYLVPYSQYGRNVVYGETLSDHIHTATDLMGDLGHVREEYLLTESSEEYDPTEDMQKGYFTQHQGFFDRLQMLGPDDEIVGLTQSGVYAGFMPIYTSLINFVPHVFWPNKPSQGTGNIYAHQLGYLADDDTTTGISFSPAGEAYHIMGWTSVILIAPVLYFFLFLVFDSLCGDIRNSPLGLVILTVFAHSAPEGGIAGIIFTLGYITAGILFVAVTLRYVSPIIGEALAGPDKQRQIRFLNQMAASRRVRTAQNPSGTIG